jgi:hypothetical protein
MRMITLAITGTLMACVAVPAMAATKKTKDSWTPTWSTCDTLAMERGIPEGDRKSSEAGRSSYRQFMVSCLAGKVEGKPIVTAQIAPAARIPAKWNSCDELAMSRGIPEGDRRSSEAGPSSYGQFMRACMRGQIH